MKKQNGPEVELEFGSVDGFEPEQCPHCGAPMKAQKKAEKKPASLDDMKMMAEMLSAKRPMRR